MPAKWSDDPPRTSGYYWVLDTYIDEYYIVRISIEHFKTPLIDDPTESSGTLKPLVYGRYLWYRYRLKQPAEAPAELKELLKQYYRDNK